MAEAKPTKQKPPSRAVNNLTLTSYPSPYRPSFSPSSTSLPLWFTLILLPLSSLFKLKDSPTGHRNSLVALQLARSTPHTSPIAAKNNNMLALVSLSLLVLAATAPSTLAVPTHAEVEDLFQRRQMPIPDVGTDGEWVLDQLVTDTKARKRAHASSLTPRSILALPVICVLVSVVPSDTAWAALYPASGSTPSTDTLPQAWRDKLNAVIAAGLVPSPQVCPVATVTNGWPTCKSS